MSLAKIQSDPNFLGLPEAEKAKVVETLGAKDPAFMGLPDTEKVKVMNHFVNLGSNEAANTPVADEPSLMDDIGQAAGNLASGAVRGAGSIGATILLPADMINQKLRGEDFFSLKDNLKRRGDIDKGLGIAGAETDSTLYKTGKFGGELAGTAGIGGVLAKGAQAANVAPKVVQGLNTWGMSTGKASSTAAGKVADALIRTGTGATTATAANAAIDPTMENAKNSAAIGGGIAAAVPGIGWGFNKARALKDALKQSPGSLAVKAAGDKYDDVIRALESSKSGVPGVKLTAGQASVPANSAEFAALQKASGETYAPSLFVGKAGVTGQQEAARLAAVKGISGDQAAMQAAVEARKAASSYDDAFNLVIKADPKLAEMSKNPFFKDELRGALKLAKAKGINGKENLTEVLHDVKIGLDAKLKSASDPMQPAISKSVTTQIGRLKDDLVGWLDNANPQYAEARANYVTNSKPINQMRVGQDLERALVAPGTGAERASSFSNATRTAQEKISSATGKPLIDSLSEGQKKVVSAINDDFARNAELKKLATSGAANLENRIGAPVVPPTGMFQPLISAARSWVNKGLGTGHEQAMKRLAPLMEDPKLLAEVMRQSTPAQRKALDTLVEQWMARSAAVESSNYKKER